jgi:hypothetical protein
MFLKIAYKSIYYAYFQYVIKYGIISFFGVGEGNC